MKRNYKKKTLKKKNKKKLEEKLTQKAMRQEDNEANIARYNAQLEYKKQLKLEQIEQRQRRVAEMQRQKIEINELKRQQQEELRSRKAKMLIEVNQLLKSGEYKTREDIYKRVFNDDELKQINTAPNESTANTHEEQQHKDEYGILNLVKAVNTL